MTPSRVSSPRITTTTVSVLLLLEVWALEPPGVGAVDVLAVGVLVTTSWHDTPATAW